MQNSKCCYVGYYDFFVEVRNVERQNVKIQFCRLETVEQMPNLTYPNWLT
jgi:hypothetical protein